MPGQAVLHVLRPRGHPRPPPRAHRVERQVQGPVRRRLGRPARGDPGPPEASWASCLPTPSCRPGPAEIGPGTTSPTTSSRCWPARWRSTPASWSTPTTTSAGSSTPSRTSGPLDDTLVYLHHRRQRGRGRGHAERHVQRDHLPQRGGRLRDHRVHGRAHRRLRGPGGLQPLRGGLGPRHEHAVPVDQAGGLPLRWHPQRDHRPLAATASRPQGEVR